MKTLNLRAALVGLLFSSMILSVSSAHAASNKTRSAPARESVLSSSAAADHSGGSKRFGLGFQTLGTPVPAFSAMMELTPTSTLQGLFGINGTAGAFQFNVGGIYRQTLAGTANAGVHAGADVILGTIAGPSAATAAGTVSTGSKFFIGFGPLVGTHFTLPNLSNLMITLDGGAQFAIVDGNFDFSLGGLSPALGLGVHLFL